MGMITTRDMWKEDSSCHTALTSHILNQVEFLFLPGARVKYKKGTLGYSHSVYCSDTSFQMFLLRNRRATMHLLDHTCLFINKTSIPIVYFTSMNMLFSTESKPICLIPSMSMTKALLLVTGTSIWCLCLLIYSVNITCAGLVQLN